MARAGQSGGQPCRAVDRDLSTLQRRPETADRATAPQAVTDDLEARRPMSVIARAVRASAPSRCRRAGRRAAGVFAVPRSGRPATTRPATAGPAAAESRPAASGRRQPRSSTSPREAGLALRARERRRGREAAARDDGRRRRLPRLRQRRRPGPAASSTAGRGRGRRGRQRRAVRPSIALYRNDGRGHFADVSAERRPRAVASTAWASPSATTTTTAGRTSSSPPSAATACSATTADVSPT